MIATQKNILSYSELTCKDKKTFKASRIYTLATQALDRYHLNMSAFYQVAAPQSCCKHDRKIKMEISRHKLMDENKFNL